LAGVVPPCLMTFWVVELIQIKFQTLSALLVGVVSRFTGGVARVLVRLLLKRPKT